MQESKRYHARIGGERFLLSGDFLRWIFAGTAVSSVYAGAAVMFFSSVAVPERLAGAPPAIMLEFAAEPTAAAVQAIAQTIRSGMQADERKPPPESESAVNEGRTHADPVVQQDPELMTLPEQAGKTRQDRPERKPAVKHRKKHREEPRDEAAKARQNRKSAAPEVDAQNGRTFAGRNSSLSEGFNGLSEKAWVDRAYRRIQSVGRRMQRQFPGVRGIVYIAFVYDETGRISAASVSRSSGNSRIDHLGLRIVERSSPLPPPPDAGRKIVPIRVN